VASDKEQAVDKVIVKTRMRRELPKVRPSKTYSFTVSDCHGYFTVGEYEDGTPGELFVRVAKMGSTLAGLMDSFARSISYSLQYGVPLKVYVKGMTSMSFAPAGVTDDPDIRTASSLIDYIFRRLALDYLSFDDRLELGLASIDDMPDEQTSLLETDINIQPELPKSVEPKTAEEVSSIDTMVSSDDSKPSRSKLADQSAPMCFNCGNQTQKAGSCYVCTSCGSTTGCS
ncbi:MAG: vitamin B12-dependent ribonucleotide reductase, partial [Candidatus Andersenbacteria bacterium]